MRVAAGILSGRMSQQLTIHSKIQLFPEKKGKGERIYIEPLLKCLTLKALLESHTQSYGDRLAVPQHPRSTDHFVGVGNNFKQSFF